MRKLLFFGAVAVATGLVGAVPGIGRAQVAGTDTGAGYSYPVPPLTVIQRAQQNQLEANKQVLHKEEEGRFAHQLELEQTTLETARRERESYLYQDNTEQRGLEAQLREDALRINQQDQTNRDRDIRARALEEQGIQDAQRQYGGR